MRSGKYRKRIAPGLAFITILLCAAVPSFTQPEGYEVRYLNGFRYGLFVPPSYDPEQSYPLILYLHGCGDTSTYDLNWYHDPIQSENPCFVLTPKAVNTIDWCDAWGTSWMPEYSPDMLNTLKVIALLEEEFSIDTNRLHVYGISMGGFGTFSLMAKNPGMFASAFSISGGGNPLTAEDVAKTPFWIFHGDADQVVPVERSRLIYYAMINAGATQVRYTEYPGVDHDAWDPALDEPTLYAWFLAQEKGVRHGRPDNVLNFSYQITGRSTVELSWSPPPYDMNPDNRVWYYKIFRDGILIDEVDNIYNTFTDLISDGTAADEYTISTVNYFFKESTMSGPLIVDGLPSINAPSGNMPLKIVGSDGAVAVQYRLAVAGDVNLCIYDLKGMLVDLLVNECQPKGVYTVPWNYEGTAGGIYLCRIIGGNAVGTEKFILMKK